jgi:hypothetical protein
VLYELLAGKPAFTGESAGGILATVVKDDPDWSSLPGENAEWLRRLPRRCLVKDRKQQQQAIGEGGSFWRIPSNPARYPCRDSELQGLRDLKGRVPSARVNQL